MKAAFRELHLDQTVEDALAFLRGGSPPLATGQSESDESDEDGLEQETE